MVTHTYYIKKYGKELEEIMVSRDNKYINYGIIQFGYTDIRVLSKINFYEEGLM